MTGIDIWLFYSFSLSDKKDGLLTAMTFIILGVSIFLFIVTILNFIKKRNAILIQDKKVIMSEYKERIVDFKDIKNIQFCLDYSGGGKKISYGIYRSGKIIFTLNDDKKITNTNIDDVKNVCHQLREMILIKE